MATKAFKAVKNLTAVEMTNRLRELENEIFQTRMQKTTGQLADVSKMWRLRKEVARIKTLQTQQQQKAAR